jgi:hypothetical protein
MLLIEMSMDQLNEMTTYQLDRSTHKAFGSTRNDSASQTSIGNIEFSATQDKGKAQLVVKSSVTGPTGKRYDTIMIFKNVTFEQEDTAQNITVQGADGKQLHFDPYTTARSDVQVRCGCMDFYWRFANWNAKHHALTGDKPAPYVKVSNRAPVNPLQKAGTCKHLYKLVQQLQNKGIVG